MLILDPGLDHFFTTPLIPALCQESIEKIKQNQNINPCIFDSISSFKEKWICLKYLGHNKCNEFINGHSQAQSHCNQKINIFIISVKRFHGENCQHSFCSRSAGRRKALDVIYLLSKALLCKSRITFLLTCNHIVVYSWDLFLCKIKTEMFNCPHGKKLDD